MIILKAIFLLWAIVYGFGNICRAANKQDISAMQMWLMGIGVVGFITLQFWLGV